jgi:hypothetical protein
MEHAVCKGVQGGLPLEALLEALQLIARANAYMWLCIRLYTKLY